MVLRHRIPQRIQQLRRQSSSGSNLIQEIAPWHPRHAEHPVEDLTLLAERQ
jgi:hypothetical protein